VLTPEGQWIIILTGAHRGPAKNLEEKAALLGRYVLERNLLRSKSESDTLFQHRGRQVDYPQPRDGECCPARSKSCRNIDIGT
jgi:hypothetical protein